jgi:hypothetical protein
MLPARRGLGSSESTMKSALAHPEMKKAVAKATAF